jgi:DNA-binding beta-propeller fold protein YncE
MKHAKLVLRVLGAALTLALPAAAAPPIELATGQAVTPLAIPGAVQRLLNPGLAAYPGFVAGMAVRSQLSPDGSTLAILTAGHNSLVAPSGAVDKAASTQFLFLYDVSGPNAAAPVLSQVLQQVNAHVGLAFSPDGSALYAAGGADDAVYAYAKGPSGWALQKKIPLGHTSGIGLGVAANASGLALSPDGQTLVVANNYNDSFTVLDTATASVRYEQDLRPFANGGADGEAGGTFPFAVAFKGNQQLYVSSDRDRQVLAFDVSGKSRAWQTGSIALDGNGLGMTYDAHSGLLFVAQDNADQVAVIDTASDTILHRIDARGPAWVLPGGDDDERGQRVHYTGAATFAVSLSPDGRTLYAVNAGSNAVAVIPLHGEHRYRVAGLLPTAYDPHDVTPSADGRHLYIVSGKSATGPNPEHLAGVTATAASSAANQYQFQLEKASLVAAPVPSREALEELTAQVARNNRWGEEREHDERVMRALRRQIKHVIYVVKENRTFDQILGDLGNGSDGDPKLTQFPEKITPNYHRLARQFVTLDRFTDPGDGSMDGWSWSLQGRVTNTETITQQINYAFVSRGLSYESEGANRNVPVNLPVAQRAALFGSAYTGGFGGQAGGWQNALAGTGNHASSDAPFGRQKGYIFDAVLQAGGTVRNYGFLVQNVGPIFSTVGGKSVAISDPFSAGVQQVVPLDTSLAPLTDVYFRGYDQAYPDYWRYQEWKREFDGYVANGNLPTLELVRLSHDHMGAFGSVVAKLSGLTTPETEQADNDFSVAKVIEAVAHSPFAKDTVIIVTEDDCQDGPDHVDSHRATAYVAGAFVKQGAVVSTHYSQVNALRTIEDLLGAPHLNLNTASLRPMTEVFDLRGGPWTFTAAASTVLAGTSLGIPSSAFAAGPAVRPTHDGAYWVRATRGFDFDEADEVPAAAFNRVLWKGLMGKQPYPRKLALGADR